MANTKIEWADVVWNPIRGCSRVSRGCERCYAERQAHRFSGEGMPYEGLTRMTEHGPVWTGKIKLVPELLDQPLHWKKPRRIFVNSMSDLFHEAVPDEFLDQVFAVMATAKKHTFQVLTKRPERMLKYFQEPARPDMVYWAAYKFGYLGAMCGGTKAPIPVPNVQLGVSVEDQETADERIPLLLQTPAAVRFISAEPLLGPIDLLKMPQLDWVIVGGESGPRARQMQEGWARNLMLQCKAAGVTFFMKQGSQANWPDFNNFESFPEDLRVREFPRT